MLLKTQGIVFRNVKFADKKIISKVYTRSYGLQSFFINLGSSPKSPIKSGLFLPLNQLELEFFFKENQELSRVKEARCFYQYKELDINVYKNAVAVFLNEILYRSIIEQESNPNLFDYIINSFQWLDLTNQSISSFHLCFLAGLSKHLGFYPHSNYSSEDCFFDLREGIFISHTPNHPNYLSGIQAKDFSDLFHINLQTLSSFSIPKENRSNLLNNLIHYYKLHITGLKEIKSLSVLQATFN